MKGSLEEDIATFNISITMDKVNHCCYNFLVKHSFNVPNSFIGFTWGELVINNFCNDLKPLSFQRVGLFLNGLNTTVMMVCNALII
jgi:hypothetical protein